MDGVRSCSSQAIYTKLIVLRDEILFRAKIHPEQYSNTLNDDQIKNLHAAIDYVCSTSVDVLGDSEKFPDDWLFKHRWGKGKKNQSSALPTGEKIEFVTVGGRTSAIVPSIQKKTGPVASERNDSKGNNSKRKRTTQKQEDGSEVDDENQPKKSQPKKQSKQKKMTKVEEEDKKTPGRRRSTRVKK